MKTSLREHYKEVRNNISSSSKKSKSYNITLKCVDFLDQHHISHTIIGGYYPLENEVNLLEFFDSQMRKDIIVSLPVSYDDSPELEFREWTKENDLSKGLYDIMHPDENQKIVAPNIIFVPMLAFDRDGYRLGYGKGHYDCTLSKIKAKKDIITVGIAYSEQEAKKIPNQEHDIKLDYIITDEETIIIP